MLHTSIHEQLFTLPGGCTPFFLQTINISGPMCFCASPCVHHAQSRNKTDRMDGCLHGMTNQGKQRCLPREWALRCIHLIERHVCMCYDLHGANDPASCSPALPVSLCQNDFDVKHTRPVSFVHTYPECLYCYVCDKDHCCLEPRAPMSALISYLHVYYGYFPATTPQSRKHLEPCQQANAHNNFAHHDPLRVCRQV